MYKDVHFSTRMASFKNMRPCTFLNFEFFSRKTRFCLEPLTSCQYAMFCRMAKLVFSDRHGRLSENEISMSMVVPSFNLSLTSRIPVLSVIASLVSSLSSSSRSVIMPAGMSSTHSRKSCKQAFLKMHQLREYQFSKHGALMRNSAYIICDVCRTANSSVNEATLLGCRSYTLFSSEPSRSLNK